LLSIKGRRRFCRGKVRKFTVTSWIGVEVTEGKTAKQNREGIGREDLSNQLKEERK